MNSFAYEQYIDGDPRKRRSFHSNEDVGLGYDSSSSSFGDRTKNRSLRNNSSLALIALFVLSIVQVGGEPFLPAVTLFTSLGLQHWLLCFWMGLLFFRLCDIALTGSALYHNNLLASIRTYYRSYRGRSNDHDCYDYKAMR